MNWLHTRKVQLILFFVSLGNDVESVCDDTFEGMKIMKGIELHLCSGGVDDHFFTDRIAITVDKNLIHNLYYDWNQISGEVVCIDDFLALLISNGVIMEQGELCDMRERCYIYKGNMFFYTKNNKTIEELFEFVDSELLQLFIFDIGGASINIENKYKLMIHTDEDIHRNLPHVHVIKGGDNVRYLLASLERIKTDKCSRNILRDEKKIIISGIKRNIKNLWAMWNAYNDGYVSPVIDFDGVQYYPES